MSSAPAVPLTLTARARQIVWSLLGLLLITRIVGMALVPLVDTTEARYGEIARKMAETGDWITPQFKYGIPFWAKPPLSTWFSALSIKLFDLSEFSVRLPSLLLCIGIMAMIWQWIASRRNRDQALLTIALLASTVLFFAAAGAVMTDASLAICTTLTMISFWNALHDRGRLWGYLLFAGFGFGLLAKGPLVGVLTFLPIVPWVIVRKEWRRAWNNIPWFSGSVLMLLIAGPWYLLAEHKTPGFLEYFIIGEHINRFLHPGWNGDKYGNAHAEPIGTIWLYWFYSAFPFSLVALTWIGANIRRLRALFADDDGWSLYLLLWVVMLLCFFTLSGNIIWPYVLPGLPAFACLAVEMLRRRRNTPVAWSAHGFIATAAITLIAGGTFAVLYATGNSTLVKGSQRDLVLTWQQLRRGPDSQLVYFDKSYHSADFYSHARAKTAANIDGLNALLTNHSLDFIAIKERDLPILTPQLQARFHRVERFNDIWLLAEVAP